MERIIFIVGPTGVGKSDAGFLLAQKIGGEIVSCDAMQVYREVNIACDKPSPQARGQIAHHMIDVVSITEEFNVAQFHRMAIDAIEGILGRKKIPIVVGGSGMYMSILLDGIFASGVKDKDLRAQLEARVQEQGPAVLHQELIALDPKAAAKIHPNDANRVVRALEVARTSHAPISELQKKRAGGLGAKYAIDIFALNRPRAQLYRRVEERIDRMFASGLVEEVRSIASMPLSRTAATIIGVPEVAGYLKGEYDLERVKYLMKLNSRHYAKRQLTWFRRDKRLQWIDVEEGQTSGIIINGIERTLGKF